MLTMWAIMSPLLCQGCCVMLVTSLNQIFPQVVSVPHFLCAWLGHWNLIAEVLKTLTSAAEVNGGKCFENIKCYTRVSNFSSQAGPVVLSGDRWVSSNGTTTYSKYSRVMAQDTTGSRTTWIVEGGTYSDSVDILIQLVIRTLGKMRFSPFQIPPNIQVFSLNFFGLSFCILRITALLPQEHHSNLSRPLSELQQTQLNQEHS